MRYVGGNRSSHRTCDASSDEFGLTRMGVSQGQLIAQGSPDQVTQDDAVVEAYLGKGAAERLRGKGKL